MKLSFVLRNKKNALKLSAKTLENFMERIKTDTKDGAVMRRRQMLEYASNAEGYDEQHPSHLIFPSVEFEKDTNDNLQMRTFNGVVAITVDHLDTQADIKAVKQAAQILHYTLAAFTGPSGHEVIILVRIAKADGSIPGDEEEADALCRQGYLLASSIYQGLLPKPIRQELGSIRSCFRMPLDDLPYYNPKALALPVSQKPMTLHSEVEK